MNDLAKKKEILKNAFDSPPLVATNFEESEKKLKKHIGFKQAKSTFLNHIALYLATKGSFWPLREIICYASAPGMGKTTFIQNLADAMERPLILVSLAGFKESSEYSISGDKDKLSLVAWAIIEAEKKFQKPCKNPVILLDELEKAEDENLQAKLVQLFKDYKEGKEITDEYTKEKIDLSQITFFATVNRISGLAPKLNNEINVNRLPDFSEKEKKEILKKKAEEINEKAQKTIITDKIITELLKHIQEPGIRQTQNALYKIWEEYIYCQENGKDFLVVENPKQWIKKNIFAYREEFKLAWKHWLLFICLGINFLLLVSWIFRKFVLKNKIDKNKQNHE